MREAGQADRHAVLGGADTAVGEHRLADHQRHLPAHRQRDHVTRPQCLEAGEREGGTRQKALIDDLPLFAAPRTAPRPPVKPTSQIEERLKTIFPDDLSPKQALALIYELKGLGS